SVCGFSRGEFIRRIWWHNVRGRSEQLLAHSMTVEHWHGDGRTWECWEAAFDADCGVACFGWRNFVVEFVALILAIDPKLYEAGQFLPGLNIEMPTRNEQSNLREKIFSIRDVSEFRHIKLKIDETRSRCRLELGCIYGAREEAAATRILGSVLGSFCIVERV